MRFIFLKPKFLILLPIIPLLSCQRQIVKSEFRSDFRITQLHCKNGNANPSLAGTVYAQDFVDIFRQPGALVRIDEQLSLYTRGDGSYECSLVPGRHKIIVLDLGSFKAKINQLVLNKGDSVRIDFLLHIDEKQVVY